MAKTLTLEKTDIQSIILSIVESRVDGKDVITGISCSVNYRVLDDQDNPVMHKRTTKYTSGTNFDEADKLSGDSETTVTSFWDTIKASMKTREEL